MDRAVECFLQAAALAHEPEQQARGFLFASGAQIRLFQYRAALQSADLASELALRANNHIIAGAASNNRATIYSQLGDGQLAAEAARQAVTLLEKSTQHDYLARALLNYGDIESESGNLGEAVRSFQEAIRIVRQAKLQDTEALAEDHLGLTLVQANDLYGAAAAYEDARRLRAAHGDTDGLSVTKQHLAKLAYLQKNYPGALELLNEAQTSGGSGFSAIPAFWSQQLRGEILIALNRTQEALISFRRAVRSADAWRLHALPGDVTRHADCRHAASRVS